MGTDLLVVRNIATTCALLLVVACASTENEAGRLTPLEDAVGVEFENVDDLNNQIAVLVGEQTRLCMIERGFEYETARIRTVVYPEGEGPGTPSWQERYGLGASTLVFDQPGLPADLVGVPVSVSDGGSGRYLAGLSEKERAAYDVALRGSDVPGVGATQADIEEYVESSDGCSPSSQRSVLSTLPLKLLFDEFGEELEEVRERINADPRMRAWESEIAVCLRKDGRDWNGYERTVNELRSDARALAPAVPPFDLGPAAQEELRALQIREAEIAAGFYACEDTVGTRAELFRQIRVDFETAFLEDNKDRLGAVGIEVDS